MRTEKKTFKMYIDELVSLLLDLADFQPYYDNYEEKQPANDVGRLFWSSLLLLCKVVL